MSSEQTEGLDGRPFWRLTPGQRFVIPVQYRPVKTTWIPQREILGGPVTGSISVTADGVVSLHGRSRGWVLSVDDLIDEATDE